LSTAASERREELERFIGNGKRNECQEVSPISAGFRRRNASIGSDGAAAQQLKRKPQPRRSWIDRPKPAA
jgi:hypothetical protein